MVAPSSWLDGTTAALRPPPKLSLSEWADQHFRLSGGSADAGRWRTRPYQREILDAITDPAVERVSVMKSARIGWTQMMGAAIAYFMAEDPCSILVVQPTVETAEIYSRELLAPMLRDVPALAHLVQGASVKTNGRTLLHKTFPGGVLSIVGANSGAGFAMISRRGVFFDEVDRYPPSAGDEGDPIALGEKRAETFWNRKILAGSTPLVEGASRIKEMFLAGDQRYRYWPCPHCGYFDFLTPSQKADRGHILRWPGGRPDAACFECRGNGCVIDESSKRDMDEAGEWRADEAFTGHKSFHVWSAYSTSPNASWGKIASEFVAASKLGPEKLRTVVNTTFGETWHERGEAPDHERLYERREPYAIGTVPEGVLVLTCGVDVQKDRFVFEVVGWAANKTSWSIDYGELHGDTALDASWLMLDELLARTFPGDAGVEHPISMLAIDSSAFTQPVYDWARRHPRNRVIAIKGDDGPRPIIGAASHIEINFRGKRMQRGYVVFPVGVDTAKSELYGWLRMPRGDGDPPPGWCHFPEHDPEYFKQLTSEHLVTVINRKTNRSARHWHVIPGRENHALDCRVYARAAAAHLGIDRMRQSAAPAGGGASAAARGGPAAGSGAGAEVGGGVEPGPARAAAAPVSSSSPGSYWRRERGGARMLTLLCPRRISDGRGGPGAARSGWAWRGMARQGKGASAHEGKPMDSYNVTITGVTPLLLHRDNIEFADQLAGWREEPSNKKLSKAGDDRAPAFTWLGCLYEHDGLVVMPSDNLMRCFMEGGASVPVPGGKNGKTFKAQTQSGMMTAEPAWAIEVKGKTIDIGSLLALSKDLDFANHKRVAEVNGFTLYVKRAKIGTSKHIRVRPKFHEWTLRGRIDVWDQQISKDALVSILSFAGDYKGLGDWRPSGRTPGPHGRFRAEVKKI